jgi:hypothetical protein
VEEQGFCNKMCSAMVGACLGVLLFVGSIPLLGWNEFNFVRNVKILDHVKDNVVEAGCAPLDSTMGKPVWVSCPVAQTYDFTTDGRLTALMAVMKNMYSPSKSLKGAAFIPDSKIYQWVETKADKDKHEYQYQLQWVSSRVDSTNFACVKNPYDTGCPSVKPTNVGDIPSVLKSTVEAQEFSIGMGNEQKPWAIYHLNNGLNGQIPTVDISFQSSANLGVITALSQYQQASVSKSTLTLATRPGQNTVGDVQTTFKLAAAPMGYVFSVIAQQDSGPPLFPKSAARLNEWATGMKGTFSNVNWLWNGYLSKAEMISKKTDENSSTTWILRFVGFAVMFLGLVLATHPVAVVPEILPCCGHFLGEVVGCILCLLCFCVSVGLSILVIGVAWLAARPLVGGLLLAGALAIFIASFCLHSRSRKRGGARSPFMDTQMHSYA